MIGGKIQREVARTKMIIHTLYASSITHEAIGNFLDWQV